MVSSNRFYELQYHQLHVDGHGDKWYLCWSDGENYSGPFKRAQDAKRELTMMRKSCNEINNGSRKHI